MVSIRNVEDSLKGIAVFKITTKLQIKCIIYSVRIVQRTRGEKVWWTATTKKKASKKRWLSRWSMWMKNISRCSPHILKPHKHRQNTRTPNFWPSQICQNCVAAIYNVYYTWLVSDGLKQNIGSSQKKTITDCKMTICRGNHWNVQRIELTAVNITYC